MVFLILVSCRAPARPLSHLTQFHNVPTELNQLHSGTHLDLLAVNLSKYHAESHSIAWLLIFI